MVDEAKWCLKELHSRAMRGAETKTRGWIGEKGCGMHRQDRVSGATAGQLPSDHTLPHSTKTLELLLSVQSVLCLALDSVIRVIKVRVLHRKAFAPPVAFFQLQREHWCRHSLGSALCGTGWTRMACSQVLSRKVRHWALRHHSAIRILLLFPCRNARKL